jgi:hypothetical protein
VRTLVKLAVADPPWLVTAVIADRADHVVHADHVMRAAAVVAAAVVAAAAIAAPRRQAYQRQPDSQTDSSIRPPVRERPQRFTEYCESL